MKTIGRQDKARLLANAKVIAALLQPHRRGTSLRARIPSRAVATNTDGWAVVVGNLGRNQTRLEIWLDRFSGHSKRKLFVCFRSATRRGVVAITKKVSRKLWPIRVISNADINDGKTIFLLNRLKRSEFHAPVLEKYADGATFFGIYDPTRAGTEKSDTNFCDRAVAFFADVIHELPGATQDEDGEVYPQYENRKLVASHLRRERSRLLANECKIRDKNTCQVCSFHFEGIYGILGRGFAEAHHVIPLGKLQSRVKTRVEDLCTVCSNCHRMLHRMSGKREDVSRLKVIIRRARRTRRSVQGRQ